MNRLYIRILSVLLITCSLALLNDLNAQCPSGEVETILTITPSGFSEEISWELQNNSSGTLEASTSCGDYAFGMPSSDTFCLTIGSGYTFRAYDDWGDGWNGATYSIHVGGTLIKNGSPNNGVAGDNSSACNGSDLEEVFNFAPGGPIPGCTDPSAINYNPAATVDDSSCVYPAANNECIDAIPLPIGTCVSGTNNSATFSSSEGLIPASYSCGGVSLDGTVADIWFTVAIPPSGVLDINLPVVPGITSTLLFLTGSCGSLTKIPGLPCANYGAGNGITLSGLTAGSTLYIRYWDFGSDEFGPYEICVTEPISGCTDPCAANYDSLANVDDGSCAGLPTGAGSDDCSAAVVLPGPGTYAHYTGNATGTDLSSCTSDDSLSVWFEYEVGVGLDSLRIYTCGSSYDTGLSLWDGCGGTATELDCNDDATPGGGDICGGTNFQSFIELTGSELLALEGTTIYIRIAGIDGSAGCGDLIIEEVEEPAACNSSSTVNNLVGNLTSSSMNLSWDVIAGSIGCQVNYGVAGFGFPGTRSILGTGISTVSVPLSVIPSGSYQLRVRCGCQISPTIIATGYSNTIFVTIPAARLTDNKGSSLEGNFHLTPNPAVDFVKINYTSEIKEAVTITIVDILGSEVQRTSTDLSEGANSYIMNVSDLNSGIYFVRITTAHTSFAKQLEVLR